MRKARSPPGSSSSGRNGSLTAPARRSIAALPEVGAHFAAEKEIAVVESVKAAADVYAPVAGTVTEVNQAAADAPESVNQDAYAAWLFKMMPDNVADLDKMLDAAAYQAVADAA